MGGDHVRDRSTSSILLISPNEGKFHTPMLNTVSCGHKTEMITYISHAILSSNDMKLVDGGGG